MALPNQAPNPDAGNAQAEPGREDLVAHAVTSSSDAFDFLF